MAVAEVEEIMLEIGLAQESEQVGIKGRVNRGREPGEK
jgi:hypothetical protein